MKIKINNFKCQLVFGGKDNLIKFDFHKSIKEFLQVKLPGYKHTQQYKIQEISCECGWSIKSSGKPDKCESCLSPNITFKRLWNGDIYLIDKKLCFDTGLLPDVYDFLSEYYDVELIDQRANKITIPNELKYSFGDWTLREDQIEVLNTVIYNKMDGLDFPRGIIDAATNYGKTIVIFGITFNLNCKTLIIVNQILLYNQIIDKFKSFGIELGTVDSLSKVNIFMAQTLFNRTKSVNIKKLLNEVELLLVDECHGAKTDTMKKIISQTNAYARFFVSGTPLDAPEEYDNLKIIGQSGKTLVKISNKDLIDSGISQRVKLYICKYETDCKIFNSYKEEFNYLFQLKIPLVKDIIMSHENEKILIILEFKDHGIQIKEYLNNQGIKCEFVHGSDPEKNQKIKYFADNKNTVLISSIIMNQAIDINDIDVGINLLGGKSIFRAKQFAGRILRNDFINDSCSVYEFKDSGHHTEKHFNIRHKLYEKELFDIKFLF